MKKLKVFLVFVLVFSLNIVSISAQGQEKELYGLKVLNESIEESVLEDGTTVTSIRTELDGDLEDLKQILENQKQLETAGNAIVLYDKFNNISPAAIPSLDYVQCYDSENIMIQCIGSTKGLTGAVTNLDTKWSVKGNVTTYQTAYPGKTVSNLSTTPRIHVTVWGISGKESIIVENNYFSGAAGSASASWGANLFGHGAIVNMTYRLGGDFSYKTTTTHSDTHWWE